MADLLVNVAAKGVRCRICRDTPLRTRLATLLQNTAEAGLPRPWYSTIHEALVGEFGDARAGRTSDNVRRHLTRHEPLWAELWAD